MKKSILTVIAILAIGLSTTFAQGFGIRAGVDYNNLNGKDATGKALSNDMIMGFNAGVNYEMPVATDFYLQPGVLFNVKGSKTTVGDVKLNYIEVPINFVYKPVLGPGKLIAGFGPYVAYGIGGSHPWTGLTETSPFGDNSPYLKPLDAGANFLFGYMLPMGLEFQFNAGLGLLDLDRFDGDQRTANTGFGVSLGYRF